MESPNEASDDRSARQHEFRCPTCKRVVKSSAQDPSKRPQFFPFCSERCKLIDLGAWFDATYRIPARTDEESDETPSEDASSGKAPS